MQIWEVVVVVCLERREPGLSGLQAACWRAPAGCGRKAGLHAVVLALQTSWSLGVPNLVGLSSLDTLVLSRSCAPPKHLAGILCPTFVSQDLRSFGKGCPWSC